MNNMEGPKSGELEWWKGFEELITRNVNTIKDFTQTTRHTTQELQKEVQELKNMLATRESQMNQLQQQISVIQARLYQNGTH